MSAYIPRVAVLLAAYNGITWIEEQLSSIRAQLHVHVTTYISVDPSSDGTEAWCAEYSRAHPDVHLLPSSEKFGGAACNFYRLLRDVDFSAFDYVSFSDQDDIWYPDKLVRAVNKMKSDCIDGYSSNVIAFWPNGRRMLVDKAQPEVEWDYLFEAAGPGCTYVLTLPLATAFKDAVTQQWSKVQEVSLHDWYCYAYARSNGFKWFIDEVAGMEYRQHENNQVGANSGVAPAITRLQKILQGWWLSQVRLIDALTMEGNSSPPKRPKLSGRISILRLAFSAQKCRRRRRDQVAFAALCAFMAIVGASR